jgi:MarR-like DNA-binding transcriptional regulator SgrR of sgrS sRNA
MSTIKIRSMILFGALVFFTGAIQMGVAMANSEKREIRTYMSYGLPLDPAHIFTVEDLDFSYALASTLVHWNDAKEPVSGLASSWDYTGTNEITFHLSPKAKWSDGTPVKSADVVASLLRAKRVHGENLKTLFDLLEVIEAKSPTDIVLKLNVPAAASGIIRKITEPMYGVVSVNSDGSLDLTRTTGPFFVKKADPTEVQLSGNTHWYKTQDGMAERVIIRRPRAAGNPQEAFLTDSWVNLLTSSSLAPLNLHQKFRDARFSIWNRSLDKVFFLSPGPGLDNEDGRRLIQALNHQLNRKTLAGGMSGFTFSDQFFIPGYVLFDPEFKKSIGEVPLPEKFKRQPLEILGIDSRLSEPLRSNLLKAVTEVTGRAPRLKTVSAGEMNKVRSAGHYDLWAGTLPVNDSNVEGLLGYVFGFKPAFIPNASKTGSGNFHERVTSAKRFSEQSIRNVEYRKVFADAINAGCVLPLFHFSTTAIAKQGMDLSSVPTTDETVTFSKVRFK